MDANTRFQRAVDPVIDCEVASLARRYCGLIDEAVSAEQGDWLADIAAILPRLHAAIASFEAEFCHVDAFDPVDLDARFELFSLLRGLLGDRDSYWLEFDSVEDGTMTGSLADDLTDIYCELRNGLRLFELDPGYGLAAWASGYDLHWQRHLIDAERHLARLGARVRVARTS
jgi:hypothetical protein